MSDHDLAARLATEAGQVLATPARERPGEAVLSEEGADGPARLRTERIWIVDPAVAGSGGVPARRRRCGAGCDRMMLAPADC